MKQDENGLTLIEVLATLTIFSIISIIIWSVFFQGYNFSQSAVSKNLMIQETNIVITSLKRIHQTSSEYRIMSSGSNNCEISITSKKKDRINNTDVIQPPQIFSNAQICFHFVLDIKNKTGSDPSEVFPNLNDVSITLTVSDKKNANNNVPITSYLYRLKGVEY